MFFEEDILFPTALQLLTEEDWRAIRAQEPEVGYAWVQPGDRWPPEGGTAAPAPAPAPVEAAPAPPPEVRALASVLLHLDTGTLTPEEVNLILNVLPVEITYVDAEDTVRYFNRPRERTFLRPPAAIGHKVQKCHPHIRYFPLRDERGEYWGTLEVVQDVTDIRALEGERRLLDVAQD